MFYCILWRRQELGFFDISYLLFFRDHHFALFCVFSNYFFAYFFQTFWQKYPNIILSLFLSHFCSLLYNCLFSCLVLTTLNCKVNIVRRPRIHVLWCLLDQTADSISKIMWSEDIFRWEEEEPLVVQGFTSEPKIVKKKTW